MPIPGFEFPELTDPQGFNYYDIPKGDHVVIKMFNDDKGEPTIEHYATPYAGVWDDDLETASSYTKEAAFTYAGMIGGCRVVDKNELKALKVECQKERDSYTDNQSKNNTDK